MKRLFGLLLVACLAVAGWMAWALLSPVTPEGQKFVLLRPGFGTRRIASELKAAGVIRSETAFVLWHGMHKQRSLKAGEYLFERAASTLDIHEKIARGEIYVHTVVIPEGFTMFDIAQAMADAGLGTREEFLNLAKTETPLIADLAPEATSLEGYLFPDTYEFTRTQSLAEMVGAMVKKFRQVSREVGLEGNVHQTVTMASIVEKETAAGDERPLVASVYYNRLAHHVALDADPSVIYAELLQGTYQGALHHEDLQVNSPYNTYRHAGLPPGPIGNPGKSALEAAMHPATSNYFYFVADGTGHHRFSESLEEHNRNVAKLRRLVRGQ